MTIYNTSLPNGALGHILARVRTYLDWAPASAPETEDRWIQLINDEVERLATESPWVVEEKEIVLPLDADFVTSESEDDVVFRHEHDPFVLYREENADLDDWPVDGSWNSRWIEITNEDGDVERRRIRDVWKKVTSDIPIATPDILYMTVDRALTITGDVLKFRVLTVEYPLPHGTISLVRASLVQDNLKERGSQTVKPMSQMQNSYAFLGGDRTSVDDRKVQWYCGSEVQPLVNPQGAPGVAKTTGQGAATWTGPDLPGTFQYCVAYGWGRYDYQSAQDESPTSREFPRYLTAPSEASAEIATTAGGNAILVYLPDVAWIAGWGESALTTSTSDVRWYHTGIRRYVFRRRKTSVSPAAPPHNNANMQRHVPADGVWRLWRVVTDETVQTLTDNGALPLELQHRPLTTDSRHLTLLPDGDPTGATEVYLRLRCRPPRLFGASDHLGLVPGADIVVALRAAASFAKTQARYDTARSLNEAAAEQLRAMRGNATGIGTRVAKRVPPRRY